MHRVTSPRRRLLATLVAALSLACALACSTTAARADGFIYVAEPPPRYVVPVPDVRPHPWPRPPRRHFPMAVTHHDVKVTIRDTLVTTRVEETFHNPNGAQLEGVYMFPLPVGAAVADFRMKIGGEEVRGEVLEKDKARKIYQDIVRRAQDPGLLEYVDRGLFRASVFPIPANGDVEVVIEYSESLERHAGLAEYVYPLDTGKYSIGEYGNVVIDVELSASQAIRSITCPSHEVSIDRHGDREVRIGFEAKKLRADEDFVLQWNVSEDALAPVLMTHRGVEKDGYFFLSITPRASAEDVVPPKDVIFAIDTSGSMTGEKIEQVKRALRYCVNGLRAKDRFNIVDFSTEARRFREAAVEANDDVKESARKYIDALVARGGTNIEEALRYALEEKAGEDRLTLVVLLTDGEPTIGVTRPDEILESVRKRNEEQRRLFVFGVGEDLNAKLLDSLVADNRGTSEYIRSGEDLELPISSFFDKVDSPVLTDLELRVPDGSVRAVFPKPLPDVFRGEQLDIVGRYEGDGHKTLVLEAKYLGERRVFEYSMKFEGGEHAEVPRLWALRNIGYLLEEIRLHGEKKELKDEIIRLSKLHGVITPYTSYLILEEGAVATRGPRPAVRSGFDGRGGVHRFAASDALGFGLDADGAATGAAEPAGAERARALRAEARSGVDAFEAESGEEAVRLSSSLHELKAGRVPASDEAFRERAGVDGLRVRRSGERTFYLQGERWIDSVLTTRKFEDGDVREVEYLSDAYFELVEKEPGIGKLLGVAPLVSFVWEGVVYSVVQG